MRRLGAQLVVHRLVAQIHPASAVHVRLLGHQQQSARIKQTLLQREIRDHALDWRASRHPQRGQKRVPELQAGQVDQQRAQIAPGHQQPQSPIAITQHLRQRIA